MATAAPEFAGTIKQAENDTTQNFVELYTAGGGADKRGVIALSKSDASSSQEAIVFKTNGVTVGSIKYNGSTLFNLEPENDANYTTTTDAEGNQTLVYNGPTLDVKERLTKADTALQTLKSAAAAAVDFAELKAAIATALVDI